MRGFNAPKIEVGYGVGQGGDSFDIAVEVASHAVSSITHNSVSAVLVFASVKYNLERMLEGISSVVGDAPILGVTTAGEICNAPVKESMVILALASPHLAVRVGVGQGVSKNWLESVTEAVSHPDIQLFFSPENTSIWQELTQQGKATFGLLFSPGNTRHADSRSYEILEELKRLSHGRMPIFGGASADDWRMETNFVLYGRRAYPDGILVAVFETSLQFGIALAHGFRPGSERATVTRARGHEILELDGKRAADGYAKLLGSSQQELEGKHLTLTTGRPVGTPDPYGQYSINVASYFTSKGAVRVAQPVTEGSILTIMQADEDSLLGAGKEALRKAMLRGDISAPAAVIVFSCALRHRILGKRTGEEISGITEGIPGVPVVGFYSFGEQGLADDNVNRHNNEVVALLALGREFSYASKVALENKRLVKELDRRVTDLKQAQKALLESEERYRTIVETAHEGIWMIDANAKILYANHQMAQMLGYTVDEMLGRLLSDFVCDIAPVGVHKDLEMGKEQTIRGHDFRFRRKDGSELWAMISTSPRYNGNGHFMGTLGMIIDITDRKQAEEALRDSETKYSTLAESSLTGIYIDQDGRIVFANNRFAEIYRYPRDEAVGIESWRVVHPEDRDMTNTIRAKRLKGEDAPSEYEARGLTKDGETIWIKRRNRRIEYNGRPAILGNIVDVTEQKRAEEALRKINEELNNFVHIVSHDLKTPIISIQGFSSRLLKHFQEELGDKGRRYLEQIKASSRRMEALVSDLLELSRIGQVVYTFADISSIGIVKRVTSALQGRLKESDIELVVADNLPTMYCDEERMYQVFENLLVNAVKFTGGAKSPQIEIGYEDRGGFHQFYVQDNGIGIDPEHHQRIFEIFHRLEVIGDEEGTGLGLAIVDRIVNNHGGRVWVESEKGKGATFYFTVPKAPSPVRHL